MPPLKQNGILALFILLLTSCSSEQTSIEPVTQSEPPSPQAAAPVLAPASIPSPAVVQPAPPPAPKAPELWEAWEYETMELPMGGFMKFATILSANTLEFDFPYSGPQRGALTLREQNGEVETILQIEKGQIQCNSYSPCQVLVRLNEESAQQYEAFGPSDNSSTSVFINSKKLPDQIAQAQRVRIQISVFQQGEPVLEFNNPGLNKALWLDNAVGKRR